MVTALIIFFITVSTVLSNEVSNVPAMMLLKPLVQSLGGDRVIGSVVAQQARRRVELGFMEYFRAGAVITVFTLVIGILVLIAQVPMAQGAEGIAHPKQNEGMTVTVIFSNLAAPKRDFKVVLLCNTVEERAKGLQGFRRLRKDEAALFVFDRPEPATFWMGSLAYPIDIIFVGPAGNVVRSYPGCRPGSRELYQSGGPVKWVLETAAGSGIKAGDRVVDMVK